MAFSNVEEIKNRLNIVEVVGSYIKLQKAGANYRAICPFHSEKHPSFFVSPARQIWHCFGGCNLGGDIFKFVMLIEGVEFGDALRILAQKAGVELKPFKPELQSQRNNLYEICELATRFFEKQLESSQTGKEAKNYLLGRGVSQESIIKWRLGYSPDTWGGLCEFLAGEGYKREEAEEAGLALRNDEGGYYDRFRGRIMFPVFDLNSQPVGFGGRVFKTEDTAKYINTPNTLLYDKSRILYGLDKAKIEIRRQKFSVLVEGYMDAIMASQGGSPNVAATSGTALTSWQLMILKRYTENIVLAFDMDLAGDNATKRGIDLAQSQGFNIKVVRLKDGKDAAEIIAKDPKEWEDALKGQKSILEFYFESAFSGHDPKAPEGKREISRVLLPVIKRIPNEIEKSFWVQKLASGLRVNEKAVEEELKKTKIEAENFGFESKSQEISPQQKPRKELLEDRLLTLLLKFPGKAEIVSESDSGFLSERAKEIFVGVKQDPNFSPKEPEELKDYFNYLALKAEVDDITEREIEPEIKFCLRAINNLEVKKKLDEVSKGIREAEGENDALKIKELSDKFNQLSKTLNNNS